MAYNAFALFNNCESFRNQKVYLYLNYEKKRSKK